MTKTKRGKTKRYFLNYEKIFGIKKRKRVRRKTENMVKCDNCGKRRMKMMIIGHNFFCSKKCIKGYNPQYKFI